MQPITALFSTGLTVTVAVIGCLTVFFLVLKLGGSCEKNHPVYLMIRMMVMTPEHVPFPPGLSLSQCWCNDH